jgi:hypothetical protein
MFVDDAAELGIGRPDRAMVGSEIILRLAIGIGEVALHRHRLAYHAGRRADGHGKGHKARFGRAVEGMGLGRRRLEV